jgi:hypothetical protein
MAGCAVLLAYRELGLLPTFCAEQSAEHRGYQYSGSRRCCSPDKNCYVSAKGPVFQTVASCDCPGLVHPVMLGAAFSDKPLDK